MTRKKIIAFAHLSYDSPGDGERVFEFGGIALMKVAEALQPLLPKNAAQACLSRIVIEGLRGCALGLFGEQLRL